jgi:hypothetical protein
MKSRSAIDYRFFIEAWILIDIAKLIILIFPFKKIAGLMGVANCETAYENDSVVIAEHVENAIRRAARYSMHTSKCYDQALAGKMMLRLRKLPSTIYFGLAKNDKSEMIAHAWLRLGSFIVVGRWGFETFTVVTSYGDFVSPTRRQSFKNQKSI